jgi:plastocyanin
MKPSPWLLALAMLAASAFTPLAPDAGAAVLRGTLTVPATQSGAHNMNAYPGHADAMASHRMAPRGAVNDAVLWIERIPASAESALALSPQPRPKLAQKDQCFMPRVVSVAAGSAVDFPNQDPIYHNVFSVSTTRRFDLGKYPKGQSRAVTFPKVGIVNVYCDIHSDMAAFVIVTPNHAYTQPASDGAWALPELPPGRYLLHAWHPDFGTVDREIDLGADGRALALSF